MTSGPGIFPRAFFRSREACGMRRHCHGRFGAALLDPPCADSSTDEPESKTSAGWVKRSGANRRSESWNCLKNSSEGGRGDDKGLLRAWSSCNRTHEPGCRSGMRLPGSKPCKVRQRSPPAEIKDSTPGHCPPPGRIVQVAAADPRQGKNSPAARAARNGETIPAARGCARDMGPGKPLP